MSQSQVGAANRGNQADYVLGTAEGWDAFGVVRWHGIEEISQPYRYDITLDRAVTSGPVDLDTLIDADATFRIATTQGTWRSIHGILAEAEEIEQTSQIILYRVLLVPHFWRARYRQRCRNFLGQSLVDLVSAVLENKSPANPQGSGGLVSYTSAQAQDAQPSFSSFTPATAVYRWDVKDSARSEDPTTRPYVAQYNESDFDFASRLLEEEGLSYYFEQGQDQVILAITDMPGVSPLFDPSATFTQKRGSSSGASGSGQQQELVRSFRDTRRLRSRAVTVRDWDYLRSAAPLEASAGNPPSDPDLSRHFEFPAGEESIQKDPGLHTATVRKERYDAERALREGSSTLRAMTPAYRFTLTDGDGINPDLQLLAVRVETYATELTPQGTVLDEDPFGFAGAVGPPAVGLDSRFLAMDQTIPFIPAASTPKPRIHGVQAAVVTAEEYPDGSRPALNGDLLARVRVRFPWDQRPDGNDGMGTSDWIRVSQFWAGAGYGALYTPRVGHEVLVAYMQGNPDDPVIVGRVYNAQHTPPYTDLTKSTVKSQTITDTAEPPGFNELRFADRKGQEEVFLHAQRDLNEVVLADHSTSVGWDQSNYVFHNQTNKAHGHREHTVDDYEKATVHGYREHSVDGYENVTVTGDRTTLFQSDEHHTVNGSRDTTILTDESHAVTGNRDTTISTNESIGVTGTRHSHIIGQDSHYAAGYDSTVGGNHEFHSSNTYFTTGDFQINGKTTELWEATSFLVKAGSATLSMLSGCIVLSNGTGASVTLTGSSVVIAGATVSINGDVIESKAGTKNTVGGPTIDLKGGSLINAVAGTIKLNG
jgi:type VI secretion system secreted protein VgrG